MSTDANEGLKPTKQTTALPVDEKPQVKQDGESVKNAKSDNTDINTEYKSFEATFPWADIGAFNEDKKFDASFIEDSTLVKNYIVETFHGDLYWNSVIVVGTCFFSWGFGRIGNGFFGLIFVLLATSSVYRAELRRFKRNARDDIQRIAAAEKLEESPETMEWLNQFLKKFWVIYMPALSDTVQTQANEVLKDLAPGFGIDALSLDEFTLGTKAPAINGIKSYTKKGADLVEMDWTFSFTPNDTSDMIKHDIEKMVKPKVALGVRVGKAFVSKSLPILLENMSVSGRVKVTLKLSLNFPHIKTVSISLLEPPKIDFSLKPVGGDTLGLDIMTFIPGLSSLITSLVDSNAGPLLYAPNHFDVDVEELVASKSNEAIGVLALTVKGVEDLKETLNPYVQVHGDSNPTKTIRTDIKADTDAPSWNETKYILISDLQQKLNFDLFSFDTTKKKGVLYASHEFELTDLLQKDTLIDIKKPLITSGKRKGTIKYDIRWFPVLTNKKFTQSGDQSDEVNSIESEVGIFSFKLHQAKGLDSSVSVFGKLNPKADLFIDGELVRSFRTLKLSNEPSWEESFEVLVTQKSSTNIKLVITDTSAKEIVIGSLEESLDSVVFDVSNGKDVFELSPQGEVRLTATWKPVSLSGVDSAVNYVPPIGVARLHLRQGIDLLNLEKVGKVDPYVKVLSNNKTRYITAFHPDTLDPIFDEIIYLPITSETEHITLELWDEQSLTKDRRLGSAIFSIKNFIKRGNDRSILFYDGSDKVIKSKVQRKGKGPKGEITYSVSFLPALSVYSLGELNALKQREEELAQKRIQQAEEFKEWEELYKKNPNKYEWTEIEDKDAELAIGNKQDLSLEQLLNYKSGTLGINIIEGKTAKVDSYINILFDDYGYPSFASARTNGSKVNPEAGDGFIRDLANSITIFRLSKKPIVQDLDHIISEVTFKTIDLIKKGYRKPVEIAIGSSKISVRFEFIPSAVDLAASETILDTGRAQVEFLDAESLVSADHNGKSDPYITVSLGEIEIFKSKVVKKTLSPVWNEGTTIPIISRSRPSLVLKVWDWDRAGSNEVVGTTVFDISNVQAESPETVTYKLDPQGTIRARIIFKPEYIRPRVGTAEYGIGLASLVGVPLKGVGAAANLASNVVGGGLGIANDVVGGGVGIANNVIEGGIGAASGAANDAFLTGTNLVTGTASKGGSLFKSVLGGKKNRTSVDQPRSSVENSRSDGHSLKSGIHIDGLLPPRVHSNTHNGSSPASPKALNSTHSRTGSLNSSITTAVASKNSARGTLTIRSGTNFGSQAQLKVSLAFNNKLKEIYRTKNAKASNNIIRWDESLSFDAPPEAEIVFGGLVRHKFSKDQELGTATIKLFEAVNNPRDFTLELGPSTIIVNFKYHLELAENSLVT